MPCGWTTPETALRTSHAVRLYSQMKRLIEKFGAKKLYVCSQLAYTVGALMMALFPTKACIFVFSPTAGIMYGTLFTMPYILVANYHSKGVFEEV
jgi:solute carrier family 45 protein 1/2/4